MGGGRGRDGSAELALSLRLDVYYEMYACLRHQPTHYVEPIGRIQKTLGPDFGRNQQPALGLVAELKHGL